jgi:integrase
MTVRSLLQEELRADERFGTTGTIPRPNTPVAVTANGKPKFDYLDMAKAVARRARIDESEVWLHKFRATFCTRALWAGVDLRTVQSWMGHTDLASTMRYLRPQRDAAMRSKVEAIWA